MSSCSCLNQDVKQEPEFFFLKGQTIELSIGNLFIKQKRKIIKLQFQDTGSSTKSLLLVLALHWQVQTMRRYRFLYRPQGLFPLMIRRHVPNRLTYFKITSLIFQGADDCIEKFGVFGLNLLRGHLLLGGFGDWLVRGAHG